jgi:hypothetical protein
MPTKRGTVKSVPQQAKQPKPQPSGEGPWYVIDPAWYETHAVSLEDVIRARIPGGAKGPDGRGRGRGTKAAPVAAWEQEMEALAEAASRDPRFVTADTPLAEAAFRLMLAERNRPLGLGELASLIRQRYAVGDLPRDVAPALLQRVLERQRDYGIKRLDKQAA